MSKNFCGDCDFNRNGLCIVHRWDVSKESPICSVYRKTYPGTVFQKITASPEVLATFLVFHNRIYKGRTKYHSAVVGGYFDSYEEAFAATLAKLNEVPDAIKD